MGGGVTEDTLTFSQFYRPRFHHISPEDALNLKERIHLPHLRWIQGFSFMPVQYSLEIFEYLAFIHIV